MPADGRSVLETMPTGQCVQECPQGSVYKVPMGQCVQKHSWGSVLQVPMGECFARVPAGLHIARVLVEQCVQVRLGAVCCKCPQSSVLQECLYYSLLAL